MRTILFIRKNPRYELYQGLCAYGAHGQNLYGNT